MDIRLHPRHPFFARLREMPFARTLDSFFLSRSYFILIGILTICSNAFALELPVYFCLVALGVTVCLFGDDLLPLIPILSCFYISPSIGNNPGASADSIFYPGNGGLLVLGLMLTFAAVITARLVLDPQIGGRSFLRAKRTLLPGIIALGCAYLLAGTFSGHYFDHGVNNLVFGALQFLSVGLLYYVFCGAVKWEKAPSHYFGWTGVMVGFVLLVEVIAVYLTVHPVTDGEIDRNLIYTGWGNYNNMGAMLTMMIPFAFQMACVRKHSWLYNLFGAVFLAGVILTCSRNSVLFAVAIYGVCTLVLFFRSRNRRVCVITNLAAFTVLLLVVLIRYPDEALSYLKIFTIIRSVNSRFAGYEEGIAQFLSAPLFGGSFFSTDYVLEEWSDVEAFTSFFPARWHNTLIQLLASCGVAGIAAYLWHRVQTVLLLIRKPTTENIFIGLSIAALLLTSLFDCHFFNIGPTLFYSMALAFMEKHPAR